MRKIPEDPLLDPSFKSPGIMEMLHDAFLGGKRKFECLQVEVTSHCAGKCNYCPHTTNSNAWKSRHMEAKTFAQLWPLLRMTARTHLQGWGEPLLHPRFFDFVKLARKAGCEVSTTTSGLGFDEDKARKIIENGLDLVAFSLVGVDPESNNARAHVPFETTCKAIELLRQEREKAGSPGVPAIHLAYLMLADRMESVTGLPQLMERLGVDAAIISTLDFLPDRQIENLAFNPHERVKIHAAEEILQKVAAQARAGGKEVYYSLPSVEPIAHAGGCRENILHTLYVNTEGDISPCVYLNVQGHEDRRKVYGNVNEEPAQEIWENLDYCQFRNMLVSGHPDSVCLGCPKRYERIY